MGRDAHFTELLKQELGDPVIEDALTFNAVLFFLVERGCIVLEVLDERARFWSLIQDLGLALVNPPPAAHGCILSLLRLRI